ncbi:MAG: hypothetical protein AAFX78_17820 [Cyanobacteria bacterium J06638_20]
MLEVVGDVRSGMLIRLWFDRSTPWIVLTGQYPVSFQQFAAGNSNTAVVSHTAERFASRIFDKLVEAIAQCLSHLRPNS